MNFRRIASLLLIVVGSHGAAESITNPFPGGRIYPQPVGILFPSLNVAPGVNAASIPANNKGTAVNVAISPTQPSSYFGSVASTGKSFGLGVLYNGHDGGGGLGHGAAIGAGYAFDSVALGLSARDWDINSGGWNPAFDASLMLLTLENFIAGAVLYDLNHDARLDVGIGVKSGKRYNIEVNLLLPPFSNLDGGYTGTLSASIFVERLGVHFRTSYFTASSDFSHTIGAGAWVTEAVHLLAQYSTANTATIGLTVLF